MIQMNLLPKQKQTYTNIENKLRVTKGERGGGIKQEVGINIHTAIFKTDNQQGPLYSTGNSAQYSVIT